jgi:hypothetical protein
MSGQQFLVDMCGIRERTLTASNDGVRTRIYVVDVWGDGFTMGFWL